MNRWIPYAFVRIVFFLITGISTGIFFPHVIDERGACTLFLAGVFIYGMLTVLPRLKKSFRMTIRLKTYAGAVGLATIFLAGYLRVGFNAHVRESSHLIHITAAVEYSSVTIATAPVQKTNSWKMEAVVDAVRINGGWQDASGQIVLYFSKHDFQIPPQYGDILIIRGSPQVVPGPSNPGEFDYKRFLSFKNIYHQQFVRGGDILKVGFSPRSWIDYYAFRCRTWADETLIKNISGDREKGLASALVLGVTDGLDTELLSAYKATGTLHVLAVSGLHVGIVYGLVLLLLKPFNRLKSGPWVVACVSICVLWAYAFVTGLSPSVLRAVTMFSFLALAKPAGRRTNIYNTLSASAFCILLYDPFLIMSVGFQLSYAAVLGIVYMQPGLYNLWEPSNRLLDEVWKISCVSIAAQLATFSLGLLYFNQFPNYFLLSNLFAIPGSFVVLVLGLAMLATSFVPLVVSSLGYLLELVIAAMNYVIFILEDLPFSLVENVYVSPLQCALLIAILVMVLALLRSRKFIWFKLAVSFAVIFSLSEWYHYDQEISLHKLTIYNIKGHTAIDLIENGQVHFVSDSGLMKEPEKMNFHIAANRIKSGVKKINVGYEIQQYGRGCSLMVWKGKSFLQLIDPLFELPAGLHVDYVIASNNAITTLSRVRSVEMKELILDSSNSKFTASKLLSENKSAQTKVYSVLHQGAFELKL